MAGYPLDGTTVVDCTEGVASGYASWLLAALGARVLKIEQPDGDRLRQLGPFAADRSSPQRIAALLERERSGRGQHIEVPLLDSGAIFAVESLMDYRLNGRVAGPLANRSPSIAPQGAYRAAGDDCWLALAVESDEQWQRLCATLERPELAERCPTAEARLAAHDEIDRAIEAWSADLDHNEATRRLQAAGVPAGPVLANWELVSDPHLSQRGYWIDTVHPEVGFQRYEGLPWKLSRTPPPTQARPAPLFGEHNDEVVQGDLGLNASQITSLRASGAVLDQPRALRAMPLRDD